MLDVYFENDGQILHNCFNTRKYNRPRVISFLLRRTEKRLISLKNYEKVIIICGKDN